MCEGENIVMSASWTASNENASFVFVNSKLKSYTHAANNDAPHTDERVYQLSYSGPGTVFSQTLYTTQATAVYIR